MPCHENRAPLVRIQRRFGYFPIYGQASRYWTQALIARCGFRKTARQRCDARVQLLRPPDREAAAESREDGGHPVERADAHPEKRSGSLGRQLCERRREALRRQVWRQVE